MNAKAYAYIRMSTGQQRRGDSYRRQLDLVQRYAVEHGLDYQDAYRIEDLGVSAFDGSNIDSGQFGEFVRDVRSGRIERGSYLLVESLDRLSRETVEKALTTFLNLLQDGLVIVTLLDRQRFEAGKFEPNSLLTSITGMVRANEESATKSSRLAAAWENKRARAKEVKLTSKCPAWLRLDKNANCFVVDEAKARIVRRIFEMAAGGFGNFAIAKKLNEDRIQPIGGRSNGWQKSYIQRLLSSKSAIGAFQPRIAVAGKLRPIGPEIIDYYPPLIDEDLFFRATASRTTRRIGGGGRKGDRISNLFSGIAKCGYCGGQVHMFDRGNRGGRRLQCDNSRRAVPVGDRSIKYRCLAKSWSYEDFEASFLTFCTAVNLAGFFHAGEHEKEISDAQKWLSHKKGIVSDLEAKQAKTFELFTSTTEQDEFLRRRFQTYTSDLSVARNSLIDAERKLAIAVDRARADAASGDELPEFVRQLQFGEGEETVAIRAAVAAHLRSILKSLLVFSIGTPRNEYEDPSPEELRRLGHTEDEIATWPECMLKVNPVHLPHFEATFATGTHYSVIPDPKNPREHIRIINGTEYIVRSERDIPIYSQPSDALIIYE